MSEAEAQPIAAPASSAPAVGALGMGAAPGAYDSSSPLGQVYAALRALWVAVDGLTMGDGSTAAGITLDAQKQAIEQALSGALQQIQEIDQTAGSYQQQLVDYGNTIRQQLITLQSQCAAAGAEPAMPAAVPASAVASATPGTFTPKTTGLIALGAALLGGMIGFGSARATEGK